MRNPLTLQKPYQFTSDRPDMIWNDHGKLEYLLRNKSSGGDSWQTGTKKTELMFTAMTFFTNSSDIQFKQKQH